MQKSEGHLRWPAGHGFSSAQHIHSAHHSSIVLKLNGLLVLSTLIHALARVITNINQVYIDLLMHHKYMMLTFQEEELRSFKKYARVHLKHQIR